MSKTFPTIKIVQRDYTRKDGLKNVFLRLIIYRQSKFYPINVFVNPIHFKAGNVTRSDPDQYRKQILIDQALIKAKKILYEYRIHEKELTFERFTQDYYNLTYGSDSFYDFYEQQLELIRGKLAPNTVKCYVSQLKKLKQFRPKLTFGEINHDFLTAYEGFIKNSLGNNKNTVTKSITFIKGMLSRAKDQGLIDENPAKDYKLQRIIGNREFLTPDELARVEGLYRSGELKPGLANVLRYFLFSCYTGLRYQDLKQLRHRDINEGLITIKMQKTGEPVNIPLIQKARELITPGHFSNQTVFRVYSDQPTNRYLKEIMNLAGINKYISFHCARHTFATVSKSLGMEYDVISKILGHTDLKTTKIYARYELSYLKNEMNKWERKQV